ncbi:Hypothetical predicted protein [Prunus dulcis]|uniref:Uncharacterized protein n=1 Tax=Prunus dulcis TaxID=3755 RepID=A0A5E4F6P2_PRUDU|nr:Hypothetical predicted protein [Prunus dulcis]
MDPTRPYFTIRVGKDGEFEIPAQRKHKKAIWCSPRLPPKVFSKPSHITAAAAARRNEAKHRFRGRTAN